MHKKTLLLLGFVLLKFALQFILVSPVYELHRDEYLHLDQGKHLAWGYLSVPPFTSWVSYLILKLGNGEFWVRFFPALFGALTMLLVWKAVEQLKGGLFALVLAGVSVLFSVLMRLNVLYQPNSMDTLCWVFLYYTVLMYINSGKGIWIWWAAVAFAVGFMNKYNVAFAVIGLLPALLLTQHRRVLIKKELYMAVAFSLVLISPNLWWQYQHGFPVFHHMQELANTQLVNVSRVSFLKDQLLYFIGSIFTILAGVTALLIHPPFRKYQAILYAIVFTFILFVLLRAKSYYAIGLYPILLAFGAVYMEYLLQDGWKKWLRPVVIAIPILLFVPLAKLAFPLSEPEAIAAKPDVYRELGMLQWEDGREHSLPQDFADMIGWKELARLVDSVYETIPDKEHTLVRTDNYGQAGAINFYSRFKDINALSYNADYIYWFPQNKKCVNLLLVKEASDDDTARTGERPYFKTISYAGKIHNRLAREAGTSVYLLSGAVPEVTAIIRKEVLEVQNEFRYQRRQATSSNNWLNCAATVSYAYFFAVAAIVTLFTKLFVAMKASSFSASKSARSPSTKKPFTFSVTVS